MERQEKRRKGKTHKSKQRLNMILKMRQDKMKENDIIFLQREYFQVTWVLVLKEAVNDEIALEVRNIKLLTEFWM